MFDWKTPCAYDEVQKKRFHAHCTKQLERLAKELRLPKDGYSIRSNYAGVAVSGEITLHGNGLYVVASQPGAGLEGLMFRACNGRKDYTGRQNHFIELLWLDSPATLAEHIKRLIPDYLEPARSQPKKFSGRAA